MMSGRMCFDQTKAILTGGRTYFCLFLLTVEQIEQKLIWKLFVKIFCWWLEHTLALYVGRVDACNYKTCLALIAEPMQIWLVP